MSIHFSRSLRKLESDGAFRSGFFLVIILIVVALWSTWLFTARVAVYATSGSARLEVDQENHPIDATVAGRVLVTHLVAGQNVRAGDVLLELDANPERLARSEARSKIAPTVEQLASLRDEVIAEERALAAETRGADAANDEALAKAAESQAAHQFALEEARRLADLHRKGLVSEIDALRGQRVADERESLARAADLAAKRLAQDLGARTQDRLARMARLKNEIAAIEGGRSEALAASDRLDYQIEQRVVRAPISGTLAEVAPLKPGETIEAGARIGTIVPEGQLKVVALFAPSVALGRVRAGQRARIRLEGFPWMQYGSTDAQVSHVSGEVRDGHVRVELALVQDSNSSLPYQHGLPAEVEVEVEYATPLSMVLRTLGGRLQVNAATLSSGRSPR